jgi:hypothetical protein
MEVCSNRLIEFKLGDFLLFFVFADKNVARIFLAEPFHLS